jgi:ParB family chromosome partitioning protein
MARKGILGGGLTPPAQATSPAKTMAENRMMPRGAVGALQSSLSRLQENAVQDIDPSLIDDAGVQDRLGLDRDAMEQLKESLQAYGQQVPVLVRPSSKTPGRFDIVYGRRRLMALKELGQTVKAMVRQLDDHALVLAQGQENTARQDLSFIEKASFAAQLQDLDYDRQTIAAALSIDLPMVSRMLKVGTAFDLEFLRHVGSAPGIGRERWLALVKLFDDDAFKTQALAMTQEPLFREQDSDGRFELVFNLSQATKPPAPASSKSETLSGVDGAPLAELKSNDKGMTLKITARNGKGFDQWLAQHAEAVLLDLHDRWQNERSED